jgi:nucleoside-diphosphate-sugar epimerase/predicted ester cyclase
MRVFVAGATGAIGQQLVPRLVAASHEVHGMTRYESKQAMLEELGAVPVVADALDPDQVAAAVGKARPDVIVHQLTALAGVDMRHLERDSVPTNRLRTEGTDHLLSAGQAVGVRRFVAQSVWGVYARTGGPVKSEEDTFDPTPAREMREGLAAIRHLEEAVLGARWTEGIVLRYGGFYGPGTSLAPGGELYELVRRRRFPLVGDGGGVWSFIHVADAAAATVAAVTHGRRGVYNVVDDDPAPVAAWLPALAQALGARKPMRVPRFIVRLFAGEVGVVMMTDARGASNAKAKRELAWRPAHPSWRQGFAFRGDPNVHIGPRRSQMSTAQATSNEATLRRFQDAINTGDLEFISKTIDEVVEPDVLIRTPLPVAATGAQALKEGFGRLHRAFPDLHLTIEDVIAEGDKVVARNTVTGTHQGEYMGLSPTGKSVTYNEIFIFRFAGGRIAETWGVGDVFSQLRQLGAIRGGFS